MKTQVTCQALYLELKLLEEPWVLVVEVLLPEDLRRVVERRLLLRGVVERLDDDIRLDLGPEVIILEDVPGEEEVVRVDDLEEALDLGPLDELLLGHVLGHTPRGLVDAEHDRVRVRTLLGGIRIGNEDERLLAGVAAIEEDHEAAWLDELWSRHEKAARTAITVFFSEVTVDLM